VIHTLRAAYGWTDSQIYDGIRDYGESWLTEAYKLCIEDQAEEKRWLVQVMPLARTPQSNQGASAMESYTQRLQTYLDRVAPWVAERRRAEIRKRLQEPPQSTLPVTVDN
jgi:hypothetical protein